MAQEVQGHFPHIVEPIKNVRAGNNHEVYGVKYLELIIPLLVSNQELCRQYAPLSSAVREMKHNHLLQPRASRVYMANGIACVDIREPWGDVYADCVAKTTKYKCVVTTQNEGGWDPTRGVVNDGVLCIMCQNPLSNDLVLYILLCTDS